MLAQIENLVKLQAVELERTRLATALRTLPAEVAQAEAALAAAQSQSAKASDALSREELLRTRLDREIATHRQKAARSRVQLDSVKTPEQAAAVEHELSFAEAEAARLAPGSRSIPSNPRGGPLPSSTNSALPRRRPRAWKMRSSPAWSAPKSRRLPSPPPAPRSSRWPPSSTRPVSASL